MNDLKVEGNILREPRKESDSNGLELPGCLYSNGEEIALFWQGLFNGTLLSSELLDEMIAIQTNDQANKYGYGVYLPEKEGLQFPCMVGVDPGTTFISSHIAEIDLTITIISNFEQSIRLIHQSILAQVWEEYGLGE